jgi:hypothetical protein
MVVQQDAIAAEHGQRRRHMAQGASAPAGFQRPPRCAATSGPTLMENQIAWAISPAACSAAEPAVSLTGLM